MPKRVPALLLMAACAAYASNSIAETLAERSQASARAVLDRAVNALGGADALQKIEVVRVQLAGETWSRLQTPTPEPPFDAGTVQLDLLLDVKQNRLLSTLHEIETGFVRHNTTVIKGGEGTVYNHRAGTVRALAPPPTAAQVAPHYRRLPHLVLRQALDRPDTLRSLGRETFEGKAHDAFTFVMTDAQQVAVYVDAATGLVSKYELLFFDTLAGDSASEVIFGDYVKVGGAPVPRSLRIREAGQLTQRAKLNVEINPAVSDRSFEVAAAAGYVRVEPSRESAERVEQLADGVVLFHNVAGPSENALAVAFKDYVVVVEAPGSSAGSDKVIAGIKATMPGKPIRYVAVTHHHGDHIGGLRSYIAAGATVITTPGNRKTVEQLVAAPHTDRLARDPRTPEFLLLQNGKRVLTDGSRTIELIDIGPQPHAREMVIAYLPKERFVFQGDLFIIPRNDASVGPPAPTTVSFARKLEELRLNVDRIGSVHGRTATIEEFRARLKATGPGT